MKKRDIGILIGGTIAGMCLVGNAAALSVIRNNLTRQKTKVSKPGQIESVDEMHADYIKRRSIKAIKAQETEDIRITSGDGLTLRGHYVHNLHSGRLPGDPVNVVLLSHGYGGYGYKDLVMFADFYINRGYDLCIIDQRTHGASDGKFITFGARESDDIALWTDKIISIAGRDCRILLHGWSMGAAAVYLAAAKGLPRQVRGVVFDCGIDSAENLMIYTAGKATGLPKVILWYILQFLRPLCMLICGFRMSEASPMKAAANMTLPILFVHGEKDSVVPVSMGRRLYRASDRADYRRMLIVPEAEHTYSYVCDKAGYEEELLKLMKHCMSS